MIAGTRSARARQDRDRVVGVRGGGAGDRASGRSERRADAHAARRYYTLNGATMVAIAAVALGIIGMLYLIQTSRVASLGYELSRLQQRHDALAIDNARLGYEVARDESLNTIQQMAVQQLGMTPLSKYRFLEVQRPPDEQLPSPAPVVVPPESIWHRIWRQVTGVGRAYAPTQGKPALPGSGEGN